MLSIGCKCRAVCTTVGQYYHFSNKKNVCWTYFPNWSDEGGYGVDPGAPTASDYLQGAPDPLSSSAVKTPCPWESRGVSAPRCVGSLRGSSPICRFTRVGGIVTNTFFLHLVGGKRRRRPEK